MRVNEIMNEGESWLAGQHRKNAEHLIKEWPDVKPGMFVQLDGWFGDVWAEITGCYTNWTETKPEWNSVNFYRYEKYGVSRKEDSSHYSYIRKFATRDQIDFAHSIVMTRIGVFDHGHVVEWPEGRHSRDHGGYETHPTISKDGSRAARDERFYGKKLTK